MKSACISVLILVPLALAITPFPDYPAKQVKECRVSVESASVAVGLDPVDRVQEQEMYFGANLTKKHFVPVFIVIENGMGQNSAIFDKSKVTYGVAASALTVPKTGSGAGKAIAFSAIPFLGAFAGAKAVANAAHVQDNLIKKELQSTTISPGASAHGFLYIPISGKSDEKVVLRVSLSKAGTDEDINLELMF